MNMANTNYQEHEFSYSVDFRRDNSKDKSPGQKRRFHYSRASRPAVSHNGIHRRRNKRFSW